MKIYKDNAELILSLDEFLEILEEDMLDEVIEALENEELAKDLFEESEEFDDDDDVFIPLDLDEDSLKKDLEAEIIDFFKMIEEKSKNHTGFGVYSAVFGNWKIPDSHKEETLHLKRDEFTEEDRKVQRLLSHFEWMM